MSEVVESLKPLPALKDMASSSIYFQTVQSEQVGSSPNGRHRARFQTGRFQETGHSILEAYRYQVAHVRRRFISSWFKTHQRRMRSVKNGFFWYMRFNFLVLLLIFFSF
ncbi:putative non-specific serine/threonine protein kinase [Helianthus annuus]|nr:putative non-specific serine/threonine protein kinase [Helianthus annuus]